MLCLFYKFKKRNSEKIFNNFISDSISDTYSEIHAHVAKQLKVFILLFYFMTSYVNYKYFSTFNISIFEVPRSHR